MPNQDPSQKPQGNSTISSPEPINEPTIPATVSDTEQPSLSGSIPVQNDLPPLPDYMTQTDANDVQENTSAPVVENAPTEQQPSDDLSGSAAPSDLPPMVAAPKKKFGGKRIIATILGIFLLVGGIGAGIVLTQQQQLFQQKAEGTTYPGTYPVYENGASSGKIVGYRYIAVPGVFEAALLRAASGDSFDMSLLTSTYGMTETQVKEASTHITNGETWVPSGTGCVTTEQKTDTSSPHYCYRWHWTTCLNTGTGMSGVGCDVVGPSNPTNPPNNPPSNPPGSSPTPIATPTATPILTPTPSGTPSITTTPTPTTTSTTTPTITPTPTATATTTSSGAPNTCNGTCGSNSNCSSNLICYNGYCRNPNCTSETDCTCSTSTSTPAPSGTLASTQPTLPQSGTDWPTVIGIGIGILTIIGSLLLAL